MAAFAAALLLLLLLLSLWVERTRLQRRLATVEWERRSAGLRAAARARGSRGQTVVCAVTITLRLRDSETQSLGGWEVERAREERRG